MSDYEEIVKVSDDGRYRVKLVQDEYPDEPEDEGGSPLLSVGRRGYRHAATHVKSIGAPYRNPACDAAIERAANEWGVDDPRFGRYLRAFHGVTKTETWSSQDYTYVTYDDGCWRANAGAPEGSISLEEYRAWCEGDVWVIVPEELVHEHVVTTRPDGTATETDRDVWAEPDDDVRVRVYGYQYAEEAALEQL